jgi:serine/threonine protein kinase
MRHRRRSLAEKQIFDIPLRRSISMSVVCCQERDLLSKINQDIDDKIEFRNNSKANSFADNYTFERSLGFGSFGHVSLFRCLKSKMKYAVKSIPKGKLQKFNIEREVEAGYTLCHPNIVPFIDHYEDDQFDHLVFEYVEGLDMFTFLERRQFKPLNEDQARHVMRQVVSALLYSHAQGVVHLDVKLDSIT